METHRIVRGDFTVRLQINSRAAAVCTVVALNYSHRNGKILTNLTSHYKHMDLSASSNSYR
jgi:hypothetical protein